MRRHTARHARRAHTAARRTGDGRCFRGAGSFCRGHLRAPPARANPHIAGGQQTRSSSFCAARMKRPFISEPEIVPDEPTVGGEGACAGVLSVTLLNSVEPRGAFVVADQAPRSARCRSPAVIPQRFGAIFFP